MIARFAKLFRFLRISRDTVFLFASRVLRACISLRHFVFVCFVTLSQLRLCSADYVDVVVSPTFLRRARRRARRLQINELGNVNLTKPRRIHTRVSPNEQTNAPAEVLLRLNLPRNFLSSRSPPTGTLCSRNYFPYTNAIIKCIYCEKSISTI